MASPWDSGGGEHRQDGERFRDPELDGTKTGGLDEDGVDRVQCGDQRRLHEPDQGRAGVCVLHTKCLHSFDFRGTMRHRRVRMVSN